MNIHTRRFIASSLLYFFIGCSLGVYSILNPGLVPAIRPVHTHINLLGWVSMMIIGISYFVIPLFVRKSPYSETAITLHFILANVGILGMTASFAAENYSALIPFALIEVFSAYLFLFNIVSTAIGGAPVKEIPPEGKFLTSEGSKEVDRWASYFTQAATFYFVIGCTLGGYMAISPSGWSYLRIHFHINLLGWVTMMIYGVAYHIFPRFSGQEVRMASYVRTNFVVANLGLVLMAIAMIYDEESSGTHLSAYTTAFAGVLEGAGGVLFVYNILPAVTGAVNTMGKASVKFILASLSYLMFGIIFGLFMAIIPDYTETLLPVHAHLNTLGWITMMIYGVGYYMIPAIAGKKLYSRKIAGFQFWIANMGLIGFLTLLPFRNEWIKMATLFALIEFFAAFLFIYNIVRSVIDDGPDTVRQP